MATGLAAGALLGAVVGAGVLTRATPGQVSGPRPTVLHAAPALVRGGAAVDLSLSSYCPDPAAPSCRVSSASVLVQPSGLSASASIRGRSVDGVLRFRVPAELVPDAGFSYTFVLVTEDGGRITYPPEGDGARIRVLTTNGLPLAELPSFDWEDRTRPSATVVRLPAGSGPGQVGLAGVGDEGGASGPSSFDVAPGGTIVVADWVNRRALRFSASGSLLGSVPLPGGEPLDIAAAGGGLVATTLGVQAQAYELGPDGRVLGRYAVGYGVTSRIVAGPVPRVRVGSGQWIPVRAAPGSALSAGAQAAAQTSTVPLADGRVGLSAVVDGRLAFVWTRPDGSRAGVALRLPPGVQPGADYFVRPLPDGGALAVQGLWNDAHFGVAAFALDARGAVSSFSLLPEPTTRMAAPFSVVRYGGSGAVLMARDMGDGMRIDRFEVR
ncbi:MAG: hypothetical protein WD096_08775 [Actinomycetota bacterium]